MARWCREGSSASSNAPIISCTSGLSWHRYRATTIKARHPRCRSLPLQTSNTPSPQMSSPSRIPSSGPTDSTLTYPPAAKVKTDEQPTAKREMGLRPGQETGAQRLRGGCVPCPVRSIPQTTLSPFIGPLSPPFPTGWRILLLHSDPLLLLIVPSPQPSRIPSHESPICTTDIPIDRFVNHI